MTGTSAAGAGDLRSAVAIVTGASSGLGRQFALTLVGAGCSVALVARRADRLAEVTDEIAERGGRAVSIVADLTDAGEVEAVVDRAAEALGLPTILVNNAGVPDAQRAHRMETALVDRVLATNVRAPYLLACAVARRLIAAGQPGCIVNISSMTSFHYAGEGAALYSISKAAVNRMTEVLAVEWAKYGINVNAIAPGAFETEMMDGMIARVGDVTQGFPRGRLGLPAQLDSTLLYLVGSGSEMVTGTVVRVDDGQTHR